jgi:hypothetical protein
MTSCTVTTAPRPDTYPTTRAPGRQQDVKRQSAPTRHAPGLSEDQPDQNACYSAPRTITSNRQLACRAGLCALSCAGTGDRTSSTARLMAGCLRPGGDSGMRGRCPVYREDMAGRRLVACLSLRWLRVVCGGFGCPAARGAGRTCRDTGFGGEHRRTVPRRGNGASGGGVPARACSRPAARVGDGAATRRWWRALCRVGLSVCCAVARRRAAGAGEVPAFRFVLVSVFRGRCPWLSVRAGGWGAGGHGHMADSVAAAGLARWRLRRSKGIWGCRRERTVKPSAQPTLVRTQHLPPPAETAPWAAETRPGGPFPSSHAAYQDVSP